MIRIVFLKLNLVRCKEENTSASAAHVKASKAVPPRLFQSSPLLFSLSQRHFSVLSRRNIKFRAHPRWESDTPTHNYSTFLLYRENKEAELEETHWKLCRVSQNSPLLHSPYGICHLYSFVLFCFVFFIFVFPKHNPICFLICTLSSLKLFSKLSPFFPPCLKLLFLKAVSVSAEYLESMIIL